MSWDGKGKSSEFNQSFFVTAIFAKNYGTHSGISHNFKDAPRSMLGAQICDLWLQDANIETCGVEGGREGGINVSRNGDSSECM